MKALQLDAEWKPREGYTPVKCEMEDKRAIMGSDLFYHLKMELVSKDLGGRR